MKGRVSNTSKNKAHVTSTPVSKSATVSSNQTRAFPQSVESQHEQSSDWQEKYQQAQQLGHNLTNISISPAPSPQPQKLTIRAKQIFRQQQPDKPEAEENFSKKINWSIAPPFDSTETTVSPKSLQHSSENTIIENNKSSNSSNFDLNQISLSFSRPDNLQAFQILNPKTFNQPQQQNNYSQELFNISPILQQQHQDNFLEPIIEPKLITSSFTKKNKIQAKTSQSPETATATAPKTQSAQPPSTPTPKTAETKAPTSPRPEKDKTEKAPTVGKQQTISAGATGETNAAPAANTPPGEGQGEKAPTSATQDPAFGVVVNQTKTVAQTEKQHQPAKTKANEAQAAAVPPPNEVDSKAQANQVGEMGQAETPPFDTAAFKAQLLKKIAEITPKNLEEADEFKDNNKLEPIKGELNNKVDAEQENSQKPLEEKAKETPDTTGIEPKSVTPLPPNQTGKAPQKIPAQKAAPKSKGKKEVEAPLQENSQKIEQKMAEAKITDQQLAQSNEPEFKAALKSKQEAQKDAKQSPQGYRAFEGNKLQEAQAEAVAVAQEKTQGMRGDRTQILNQVTGQQVGTKGKDEQARTKIAGDINKIYQDAKTTVEKTLSDLDTQVGTAFDEGAAQAKQTFENYVDRRMNAYKDDRYSGALGWGRWIKDKLVGMPSEVNAFYQEGRDLYIKNMDGVIDKVVKIIGKGLTQAKAEIAKGKQKVQTYVAQLPQNLKAIGQEAATDIQSQFKDLEQSVDNKQNELIDSLAQKYQENLQAVDSRIEEMKAANAGFVQKALDAVVGVIKTILKLTAMLMKVLARIAEVVGLIIKDPIGFLGNLIAGLKQGFENFVGNIAKHMQAGLIGWLTGALGETGIQIPDDLFSLSGIFSLVVQVLGVSWNYLRGKAVKMFGERTVTGMEKSAGIFTILRDEGAMGLWKYAQDQFSDLKETVIEQIKDLVITQVIQAGIKWLIGLLTPASAFVKAAMAIYDIVMFFVNQGGQIIEFVNAIIDAVAAIAGGAIGGAAKLVENALVKSLPVMIGFLASLLGVSGLAKKVQNLVGKIRGRIDKAIDKILLKAQKAVKKLFKGKNGKSGKGSQNKPDQRTRQKQEADLQKAVAEVEEKMKQKNATPSNIKQILPSIKSKYKLTSLKLIKDNQTNYHVEAEINPKRKSDSISLKEGRDILSSENKELALKELEKITNPEQVNNALVELVKIPGNENILERYKNGPGDCYKTYLSNLKDGDNFDWPLTYLRRRASFKRGKAVQKNWAEAIYGSGVKGKQFKIKRDNGTMEDIIPDIVTPDVIADVKDVKQQYFSPQLIIYEKIAHADAYPGEVFENDGKTEVTKRRRFELIVRSANHSEGKTKVFSPLVTALDKIHYVIKDK